MDLTTLKNKDKKKENIQKWTSAQENLLAEWSEKATCFRWLHSRSEKSYRFKNYSFTIPVIILSTLTGTANFAMDSFVPDNYKQIAMACVGGVNIFAGILSTLQNFLRYAELMETHRMCEVQWSKFGRNISVELAIDPKRRKPADDFLKICRADYDRLIEQSPPIDDNIIKEFKRSFKESDIKKPDICNGLDKCKIYEYSPEERQSEIVADAGRTLLKGLHNRPWKTVNTLPSKNNQPANNQLANNQPANASEKCKQDAKEEMDGLLNMGKVSAFKTSNKNDLISSNFKSLKKEENPMNIIHEIVSRPITVNTDTVNTDTVNTDTVNTDTVNNTDNNVNTGNDIDNTDNKSTQFPLDSSDIESGENDLENDLTNDFIVTMEEYNDK